MSLFGVKIKQNNAFTIVELLVVIVVIGIIASITLISYTGTTQKVTIASLKSDLDSASKLLKMDQAISGFYPNTIEEANSGRGLIASPGTVYQYFPSPTGFCIMATKGGITYRITDSGQSEQGDCSGYGLAVNLNAGNAESVAGKYSVINWDSWTVGAGGAVGYVTNGDGNSRILDSNPWGNLDVVWDVSNQDVASDADGGWNGSSFSIDNTKKYRFSVFVRRKVIGDGSFYLGLRGAATVVTNSVPEVSDTSARLFGNVAADGGAAVTERGFVYGDTPNPVIGGAGVAKVAAGNGTGSFTAVLTGLEPNTAYYVRAYAVSSAGTAYGAAIRFLTDEDDLDDIPKTGDYSSPWIWWLLCGVSAAGITALAVLGRRRKADGH